MNNVEVRSLVTPVGVGNLMLLIVLILWGGMLWLGVDLMEETAARYGPDYPRWDHTYYVVFPVLAIASLVWSGIRFNFVRRSAKMLKRSSIIAIIGLVLFLLSYGGGV